MSKIMRLDQFEYIVVVTVALKMDVQTMHIWERHRNALATSWATPIVPEHEPKKKISAHLPSWTDMYDFLKSETKIHTQTEMQAKFQQNTEQASGYTPTSKQAAEKSMAKEKAMKPIFLQCTLCCSIHPKFKCRAWLDFSYTEKWAIVLTDHLCAKCLLPEHAPAPCEDSSCMNPCKKCEPYGVIRFYNSTLYPLKHGIDPTHRIARDPIGTSATISTYRC